MTPAYQEAETYFAELWHKGQQRWLAGDVTAAAMRDGATIPVDYCLSTVAFVNQQNDAARIAVEEVRRGLMAVAPQQFYYLPESTHITLLGCTQRHPTPDVFTVDRIAAVRRVVATVLQDQAPVEMQLKGVGVLGNQVFIPVYPLDRRWALLRERLDQALQSTGEQPLSHANKAPIHMNIMRVTAAAPSQLQAILDAVAAMQQQRWSKFTVSAVDYVLTDFVISPVHTQHQAQFILAGGE
ncbi:MAG: 2'-5' RNA ligase family protein [Anaerolineae bacterium]|nr:2'-5' RNA ligase family protein [Anaerolineae bacterium]